MTLPFHKYHGTGNDFILIDNREGRFPVGDPGLIARLCHRRFGIGADGLILLQEKPDFDFDMVYFNADGNPSSMCGNGGRCMVAFAKKLGIIDRETVFHAVDGAHRASLRRNASGPPCVQLMMQNVTHVEKGEDYYLLDTGSPHYVIFVEDLDDINVVENGQAIRYSRPFRDEGVNVNFVEKTNDGLLVATYERGVEAETLSCGTGVTAAAICYYLEQPSDGHTQIPVRTKGGQLEVRFQPNGQQFEDVWLCGSATPVFEGVLEV